MRISAVPPALFLLVACAGAPLGAANAVDANLFYAPPSESIPPRVAAEAQQAVKLPQPPRGRVCFSYEETRDQIAALRLTEPSQALRNGRLQGEALRAKLCRWKPDELVYEIAVLRRDGHIIHVYMNAQSGKDVPP